MAVNAKIISKKKNRVEANVSLYACNITDRREEVIVGDVVIYLRVVAPTDEFFSVEVMLMATHNDDTIYLCKLSSTKLGMVNQKFYCDDSNWRIIHEQSNNGSLPEVFVFDLLIQVEAIETRKGAVEFAVLHDDTALTDFELCAEDGSVCFHSAVLAAASPALRRMLTGRWVEAESRNAQVQNTTKQTLQHLKDYLYLNVLPDEGVENLLLLASYYLMTELEKKCINKLLTTVTAENSSELMKFALSHNLMNLYYGFLKLVNDGDIVITNDLMEKFNVM